MQNFMLNVYSVCYQNDNDALVPELWANESLAILEENMVAANLVHRDFEPVFAKFGDVVHTRRPAEFVAKRKSTFDDVTVQDASVSDVQVRLDQHCHVSFMIRDGEETLSLQSLIPTHLRPAVLALSRIVDQVVLGQYPQFLANAYGTLDGLTNGNVKDRILGTRNLMNINKAYVEDRNLIWSPSSETVALSLDSFTNAQDVGDQGYAMKEAWLGRKFGFNNYMCQNMADIATGNTTVTGAVNLMAGYAAGTTSLVVDGFVGTLGVNQWVSIAGDPQRIVSSSATLGAATGIVIAPGLRQAVVNDAVITAYTPGQINNASGYAAGWTKPITVDTFSVAPKVGQLVTFGTTTSEVKYTIVQASTTSILLDRALEAAVVDDDKVNIGPAGSYNLAFHKNAMTLVIRPLNPPQSGVGAKSATISHNGLTMRVTITYNGNSQGHLVTLDFLAGIKVLDTNLGAVLLG